MPCTAVQNNRRKRKHQLAVASICHLTMAERKLTYYIHKGAAEEILKIEPGEDTSTDDAKHRRTWGWPRGSPG